MQKKKNIRLLIILLILIMVNVGLMWYNGGNQSNLAVDPFKFTLQDTSGINRITLTHTDKVITLQKDTKGWSVNDRYNMSGQMQVLILAVLSSIETKRPVANSADNAFGNTLKQEGVLVEVYRQEQQVAKFYTCGNATKTVSYMMDAGESIPYVVNIPGYSSFISGLFALAEGDWRDKSMFPSSRHSVKSIWIRKAGSKMPLLDLTVSGKFFKVANVQKIDTAVLMDYLQQTIRLEADEFIQPGEHTDYDSLAQTTPEYVFDLVDFNEGQSRSLHIYNQISGDHQRLVKTMPGGRMAGLRNRKFRQLIQDYGAFEMKN